MVLDGHASEDASLQNTGLIQALRHGGDLLNVFGDFPTLTDPRHADAYSPLWDAQLGLWTPKAIKEGLDTRQIDENQVFNLAATRPDLLTGVDPATGQPVTVRRGRCRHQLRGARLVGRQAPDGQPRTARSGLAVPAALIRQTGGATAGRPTGSRVPVHGTHTFEASPAGVSRAR